MKYAFSDFPCHVKMTQKFEVFLSLFVNILTVSSRYLAAPSESHRKTISKSVLEFIDSNVAKYNKYYSKQLSIHLQSHHTRATTAKTVKTSNLFTLTPDSNNREQASTLETGSLLDMIIKLYLNTGDFTKICQKPTTVAK